MKPNVKTYTTLIHGWARASLPEKALRCFEEMKLEGLRPDKAVYHCLMTSLLSRATFAEEHVYLGILSISREMVELCLTVDMGTAVHWSKCLRKIERTGGELTEALQKTFPPAWNSLDANSNKINHNIADVNSDSYSNYENYEENHDSSEETGSALDDDDNDDGHRFWF